MRIAHAFLLLLLLSLPSCFTKQALDTPLQDTEHSKSPTLILVSFDGCRYDYPSHAKTPALDAIASKGIRADRLKTAFPSKTFPNHLTIVTGLYPGHHGIIANTIYDSENDRWYRLSNGAVSDASWYQGEPIWVTAEKQGIKTATLFWPGSEAPIQGIRPTYWKAYDHHFPFSQRVEQVLNWLDLPKGERPQFITLYFHEPDESGHRHGPLSPEALAALEDVDTQLGMLLEGLKERGLENKVNLLIVSDHGMAATSRDSIIFLDDYINMEDVQVIDWSPVLALRPKEGKEALIYEALKGAHPHLQIYRKEEIPQAYHYNHPHVQPIIGIADLHWSITTHPYFDSHPDKPSPGAHGYESDYTEMDAIFYAQGPAFKQAYQAGTIENIHLYELMCHLLGIEPAPNDGSLDAVEELLKE